MHGNTRERRPGGWGTGLRSGSTSGVETPGGGDAAGTVAIGGVAGGGDINVQSGGHDVSEIENGIWQCGDARGGNAVGITATGGGAFGVRVPPPYDTYGINLLSVYSIVRYPQASVFGRMTL